MVDLYHRGKILSENNVVATGHPGSVIAIHDRYAANHKVSSKKRAIIILQNQFHFMEFLHKFFDLLYGDNRLIVYIIKYCLACLKFRRTPPNMTAGLRQDTFVNTATHNVNRNKNNMYDLVTDIIRFSLTRLPIQHYGYILMLFCGWKTYDEMTKTENIIQNGNTIYKCHKLVPNEQDDFKFETCNVPKWTTSFNVIKQICRMVQITVPTKKQWSQCGFHKYLQWKGELESFYVYVDTYIHTHTHTDTHTHIHI